MNADVNNVRVECTHLLHQVIVTVSGLDGASLILHLKTALIEQDLEVSVDGDDAFEALFSYGIDYRVTLVGQPPGQTCEVKDGSGTIQNYSASVTVACIPAIAGRYIGAGGPNPETDHVGSDLSVSGVQSWPSGGVPGGMNWSGVLKPSGVRTWSLSGSGTFWYVDGGGTYHSFDYEITSGGIYWSDKGGSSGAGGYVLYWGGVGPFGPIGGATTK